METVTIKPSKIKGKYSPPSSKSLTIRYMALCALAGGGEIRCPLWSLDTKAMLSGLSALGMQYRVTKKGDLAIDGMEWKEGNVAINAGGSAATLRFLMAMAVLRKGKTTLIGNDRLMKRPHQEMIKSINKIGGKAQQTKKAIVVEGPIAKTGGKNLEINVDLVISSQFASALILIAPVANINVYCQSTISRPYLEATMTACEAFYDDGRYNPVKVTVPWDPAGAAPVICSAVGAGNKIKVEGADWKQLEAPYLKGALVSMGCQIKDDTVFPAEKLEPLNMDMQHSPDIFLPLAVLAANAKGSSYLRGVGRLKYKESDRLIGAEMTIKTLGGKCRFEKDKFLIEGTELKGGNVKAIQDHRVVMSAIEGNAISKKGGVVEGLRAISKSYPAFLADMGRLGLDYKFGKK